MHFFQDFDRTNMNIKSTEFSDYTSGFEVEEEDAFLTSFNGQSPVYFNVPSPDLRLMKKMHVFFSTIL